MRKMLTVALVLAGITAPLTHAIIIGFEGPVSDGVYTSTPYTENGYTFSVPTDVYLIDGTTPAVGLSAGIASDDPRPQPSAFLEFFFFFNEPPLTTLTLVSDSATPFALNSMDFGTFIDDTGDDSEATLTITGQLSAGGTVTRVLNNSGNLTSAFYEPQTFDASWSSLSAVDFTATAVDPVNAENYRFGIDNIDVGVVPEPASLALLGLSAGCALFIRRQFML